MSLPACFEEKRLEALHRSMADNLLSILVTHGANGLDANHMPYEFDASQGEHGILRAHLAPVNSFCKDSESCSAAFVIFKRVSV
jgi:transcriptional regulator